VAGPRGRLHCEDAVRLQGEGNARPDVARKGGSGGSHPREVSPILRGGSGLEPRQPVATACIPPKEYPVVRGMTMEGGTSH